jgi:hypothetical protein
MQTPNRWQYNESQQLILLHGAMLSALGVPLTLITRVYIEIAIQSTSCHSDFPFLAVVSHFVAAWVNICSATGLQCTGAIVGLSGCSLCASKAKRQHWAVGWVPLTPLFTDQWFKLGTYWGPIPLDYKCPISEPNLQILTLNPFIELTVRLTVITSFIFVCNKGVASQQNWIASLKTNKYNSIFVKNKRNPLTLTKINYSDDDGRKISHLWTFLVAGKVRKSCPYAKLIKH